MTLTVEQQRIVEENLGLVRAVLSRCVSSPGSTGIYSYEIRIIQFINQPFCTC